MKNIIDNFRLKREKEDLLIVIENIDNGIVFRGTNLWILIFAIFIASLGLNVNSTAVIIGAMLISPLMGPIMGIGLGMGINKLTLIRRAFYNYFIATVVALTTSTIFFLISPLNDAHSEILARTSPTIYDVLIALFGGFAGIVATSSKQKGNVITGVAIATALMPPLCTAGYGLATMQFNYFIGAFYLFIINTVFIALATFIMIRLIYFSSGNAQDPKTDKIAAGLVWFIVLATLLPSLYFGYDMIRENRFIQNVNQFITNEAHFPNDYLLNKKIDAKKRQILLVFGGKEIMPEQIEQLKGQLLKYKLENTSLEVKQGFAYLPESDRIGNNKTIDQVNLVMAEKEMQEKKLQLLMDSLNDQQKQGRALYEELKAQYPVVKNAVIQPVAIQTDSSVSSNISLVMLTLSSPLHKEDKQRIENWLKVRLVQQNVKLVFQ